jgi:sarcosine oxidase subunit beta
MAERTGTNFDVIIIGAGSIGTPAAFSLAKAGLRVLVIDKEPSVGQASNKRAIGGVRATHSDPAKISLCLRSIEIFSTWHDQYGDDIEWQKGGYSFVAYREDERRTLKDLLLTQKKLGLNIDWYDKEGLLEIVPDLNPENLFGGTFSPDDGNCSPLLAVHAFYRQAVKLGVIFHFQEPIEKLLISNDHITGIKTSKGEYHSKVVINAAGAWAKEIAALGKMDIPVNPDSHEAAITEPVAQFLKPMIVDIKPTPGSANYYFYQHQTGQIVFCITPSPSIWGFDVRETSTFLPMVARRMVEIMPRLRNIRVRRTWRGLYPMTPDGFPIIGWSQETQGFLQAAGMCGQGFMLGPGVGELLTRLVQNELTPKDNEILPYISPYRQFVEQEKLK